MNKLLKTGLLFTGAVLLFGCDGHKANNGEHSHISPPVVSEYRPVSASNKLDFYAIKDDRKDPDCFYMGHGDHPPWASSNKKPQIVPVIIGSNFNGQAGYQRLNLRSVEGEQGFSIDEFQKLLDSGDISALEDQFANLPDEAFSPHQYTERELNIAGNVGKALPNAFDIVIPYYSKIVFFLRDSHERFDAEKPFRVAVGVSGGKSPFYGPAEVSPRGRVMKVKYLSLPKRDYLKWDYIEKRKCSYYYELTLDQSTIGAGNSTFGTVIIIDPDGEGNGGPDFGEPPTWP